MRRALLDLTVNLDLGFSTSTWKAEALKLFKVNFFTSSCMVRFRFAKAALSLFASFKLVVREVFSTFKLSFSSCRAEIDSSSSALTARSCRISALKLFASFALFFLYSKHLKLIYFHHYLFVDQVAFLGNQL